jgi:hypothetical protein
MRAMRTLVLALAACAAIACGGDDAAPNPFPDAHLPGIDGDLLPVDARPGIDGAVGVVCGAAKCTDPGICCHGGTSDTCVVPAMCMDTVRACDGPEDCMPGASLCCIQGNGTSTCEAACAALRACHNDNECNSGVCCPQGFCGPGCD